MDMKVFLFLMALLIITGCSTSPNLMNSDIQEESDKFSQTVAEALCGNSIVEGVEQCDDGNTLTEKCDKYGGTCEVCNSGCQKQEISGPFCGDGIISADEQCDDGNAFNSDDCPTTCKLGECGNGVQEVGEDCDLSCHENAGKVLEKYYPNEYNIENGFSFKFNDTCSSECGTNECSGMICTDMSWDRGRDPMAKGFATVEVGAFKFQLDNTIVPMVRGITKKTNYLDYCKSDLVLVEYYCADERLIDEEIICDRGCTDGKCT